jgi:hypothetical protein
MMALDVLVRCSQGISDDKIAIELGQRTGGDLIARVYGDIPQNWKNGGTPMLNWLPNKAAWKALNLKK